MGRALLIHAWNSTRADVLLTVLQRWCERDGTRPGVGRGWGVHLAVPRTYEGCLALANCLGGRSKPHGLHSTIPPFAKIFGDCTGPTLMTRSAPGWLFSLACALFCSRRHGAKTPPPSRVSPSHGNASPCAHMFCSLFLYNSAPSWVDLVPLLRKKGSENARRPLLRLETRARRPRCVPCLLDFTLACTPLMLRRLGCFFNATLC